jgi:hypothetical protein
MKNGFAIIVGKVIDMVPETISMRNGNELQKLKVLVKPSSEAVPIELEALGDTADKFKDADLVTAQVIIKCDVSSREWKKDDGSVKYFMGLRIREWDVLGESPAVGTGSDVSAAESHVAHGETPNLPTQEVPF